MMTDANVTLVLTRFPLTLSCVDLGNKPGKDAYWGRLFAIKRCLASACFDPTEFDRSTHGQHIAVNTHAGQRTLHWIAEHGEIGEVREFDNLEWVGGFVPLNAHTDTVPIYSLKMALNPRIRNAFEAGGVKDHNGGCCFRVMNHPNKKSNGVTAGILVHEAPHVGGLVGCIAAGKRQGGRFGDFLRRAMNEIFQRSRIDG